MFLCLPSSGRPALPRRPQLARTAHEVVRDGMPQRGLCRQWDQRALWGSQSSVCVGVGVGRIEEGMRVYVQGCLVLVASQNGLAIHNMCWLMLMLGTKTVPCTV